MWKFSGNTKHLTRKCNPSRGIIRTKLEGRLDGKAHHQKKHRALRAEKGKEKKHKGVILGFPSAFSNLNSNMARKINLANQKINTIFRMLSLLTSNRANQNKLTGGPEKKLDLGPTTILLFLTRGEANNWLKFILIHARKDGK